MNSRRHITYCSIIILGYSLLSCAKAPKTDYFSKDVQIIQPSPSRLSGTLLIDSLLGISNVEVVDSFIVLISPRNEKLFNIFDFSGNPKGNFGLKGQGPNDLLNCRPTGQKETINHEVFIWVNDISNMSLKKVNLTKSILEQHLTVDDIISTYPMSLSAFKLNDSITVCESMTHDNYSLIKYDYINKSKLFEENIYLNPSENPFSLYKSLWRINHKNNIMVGAMLSINQLNLWDLDTDKKKSVVIGKPYLSDQIIDKESRLGNRTFFCDLEVSRDFIFALYMDQEYNLSYETPKEMTVFVFNWDLDLITSYVIDQYILDIAVDADQKKLYGVREDNSIFEYSIDDISFKAAEINHSKKN